ncbi:MAG: hypothetical protein RJQ01_09555 [Microcella sp.]|uniref:hypothetical protein n=1 Tax=Microcella sp. TaxID=1913979 RepID=UPI003314DF4C
MTRAPRQHRLREDDSGNVMIAVIGLIAVTSIITLTISTATVQAIGYTSLTRAGVQSQAAAEAGAEAMRAALETSACPADGDLDATYGAVDPTITGAAAAQPFYSAEIEQRAGATAAWTPGCPSGSSTHVRIVSTGFALNEGVAESASALDSAAVEVVYDWVPGAPSAAASGAAVFSYGSPGLSNSLELVQLNGNSANVMVREGSIQCSNSVTIEGDIVAANGNINLSNTCSAEGDVWASGTVSLNNNQDIGGDVIAVGSGQSTFSPSASIGGGVYVGGTINTWGQRCSSGATGWDAAGNACALARSSGADPVLFNQPNLPRPVVPDWVDVDFRPSDWTNEGWNVVTYTGPCNIDRNGSNTPAVRAFSQYTTPTVVDVRGCTGGFTIWYTKYELVLKTDLTFITPRTVNIGQFEVSSDNPNSERRLRFITPDTVPDARPTTSGCGRFDVNNTNTIAAPVAVLIYSPCTISNSNRLTWRGHYYGGVVNFSNNSELTFVPIGIPGYNFDGGQPSGGGGAGGGGGAAGGLGELREYRDISTAGS